MAQMPVMPKWKPDATEFVVALTPTSGTHDCKIPTPVVEKLGTPPALKFTIAGNKVLVTGAGR